jgi:hypothetical protein
VIELHPGPTGWQAGLVAGPDVWEVIGGLLLERENAPRLDEMALVAATSAATGLSQDKVKLALRYYASHPVEIDTQIAANQAVAEEAEVAWLATRTEAN